MSVLFTKLGIWQKAAMRVGAMRIVATDLTAPSSSPNPAAQYLTDMWPYELQEFLEEHVWSFSIRTTPMIPLNPPIWLASTAYTIGNYVLNGGYIYVCVLAYTSSSVFTTDLGAGYWQICYPVGVPQNPPAWAVSVIYTVGCVVYQGGSIYQCVVQNTSTAVFANDLASGYWTLVYAGSIAPAAWVTAKAYYPGQFVIQTNNIYLCVIQNTSGTFATDLSNGYWEIMLPLSPLIQPLPIMNDGCNNPYAVPMDFINPYKFGACAFYRKEEVGPPYLPVKTIILMCNNSNIPTMKYVAAYTRFTNWSAKAIEALATKLAYKLCFKVSEAAQYMAALEKESDTKLISAIATDSNTTSPDEAIADEWFIARLRGSAGAVGLGPDNDNVGFFIPGVDNGW